MHPLLKNLLRRARVRLVASARKRSVAAKAGWEKRRLRLKEQPPIFNTP